MQYQLYNIVDIKESKWGKRFKRMLIGISLLVEILLLTSAFFTKNFIAPVTYFLFIFLVCLEMEGDHRDKVLLFLTFDETKVILFYPNINNRRRGKTKTLELDYRQIDLEYKEKLGILILHYEIGMEKNEEVLYLNEQNKKSIIDAFQKYMKTKKVIVEE